MHYENDPLEKNSTLCKCALSFAGCHSKMDMTRDIILHFGNNKTSKIDVIPVVIIFVPLQLPSKKNLQRFVSFIKRDISGLNFQINLEHDV